MRDPRRRLLAAACLLLPAAASAVLATGHAGPRGVAGAEAFQRLVGGLGMGPAVNLSRCGLDFDERPEYSCTLRDEPIPVACTLHALPGPAAGAPEHAEGTDRPR